MFRLSRFLGAALAMLIVATTSSPLRAAEDPGFVDWWSGNLALAPDAVVFKRLPGFRPIPFHLIGRVDSRVATDER